MSIEFDDKNVVVIFFKVFSTYCNLSFHKIKSNNFTTSVQEGSLQIFQRFLSEVASRVVKFKYRFPISVNFDEVMNIECKIEK